LSLPRRVGNIGAGALIGSFLVFDEVHLLDPNRSLATTVEMLARLKGLAQFVLMTATMPDSVMAWLAGQLDAHSLALSADDVQRLPSHATKRREFQWMTTPLTAQEVIESHKCRTIVIVNTVGRAQELYRKVADDAKKLPVPPSVFLLHSRFFRADREYWESQLAGYFGPKAHLENAILISTQVVEAGVDISADVLLTELAPLNSLLQRAGRVARYKDRNHGKFVVFELIKDDQGRTRLGPYRDERQLVLVDLTRELLSACDSLQALSYMEELKWLKQIHEVSDRKALAHLDSLAPHKKLVLNAMDGLDDAACSRLIRETGSVNVVLTSQPEALKFNARAWPELLSVPRTSLFTLKESYEKAGTNDWVLKVPEEIESESGPDLSLQWRPIKNAAGIAWLVAINPAYASYSKEVGLELNTPSGPEPKVVYRPSPPVVRFSYKKEQFTEHARRVTDRCGRILGQYSRALNRLKQRYDDCDVASLFPLACALHDTGKLQSSWQHLADEWQRQVDQKLERIHRSEPLAHTDFDPERDRGKEWPKFPPHAACGGFALLPYFQECFSHEVAILLCTAITRHHGSHTKVLSPFDLCRDAGTILEQCLPISAPRPIIVTFKSQLADIKCFYEDYLLHLKDFSNYWPLYVSIVRVLRLADQGSFQES
jgi:CRISPR-associated endonuclease/helicase Cas3